MCCYGSYVFIESKKIVQYAYLGINTLHKYIQVFRIILLM